MFLETNATRYWHETEHSRAASEFSFFLFRQKATKCQDVIWRINSMLIHTKHIYLSLHQHYKSRISTYFPQNFPAPPPLSTFVTEIFEDLMNRPRHNSTSNAFLKWMIIWTKKKGCTVRARRKFCFKDVCNVLFWCTRAAIT